MARVSTYLDFPRNAEVAFTYYKSKFGVQWMFNCTEK